MGVPARNKQRNQETISSRAQIIVLGLVIAIIGSVIAGSYQKATLTNYAGFAMLLGGVAIFVFGLCATACASMSSRFMQSPTRQTGRSRLLHIGIWVMGVGIVLGIFGSTLSGMYTKASEYNIWGFAMLLTGICCAVLGAFGTLVGTLQANQSRSRRQTGLKVDRPRFLNYSVLSIGVGLMLIIVGSVLGGAYPKDSTLNYAGFGTLLVGVGVLTLGMTGTAVTIVKSTLELDGLDSELGVLVGSIWAIGIGALMLIIGSLIAGSYAKTTLMNYSGFGMILSGTAVFVYGLFETARFSTMGYLSGKLPNPWEKREKHEKNGAESRFKTLWANTVRSTAIFNLAGVMAAMGLLFFSLWQLDMIVSGPVWWAYSSTGPGWSYSGPGPYANKYFQCYLWKTTIGQAYDTLFMLIFVSFIILFASAFFWPRGRTKNADLVKAGQRANVKNRQARQRRVNSQVDKPLPTAPENASLPEEPDAGN